MLNKEAFEEALITGVAGRAFLLPQKDNASLLVRDPLQTPRKLALLRRHTFPGITDSISGQLIFSTFRACERS